MSVHSSRGKAWRKLRQAIIAASPWCAQCGATERLEVDHVIPRAAGGGDNPNNLRVLCATCNRRKGARIETWPPRQT